MADFSSLQIKIDDFKTKVVLNSISPLSLGSLLDEILQLMGSIMSKSVESGNNADKALEKIRVMREDFDNTIASIEPVRVPDEETLVAMASRGELEENRIYYVVEEDS